MPTPTLVASLAVLPLAATRWRVLLSPLPLAGLVFEAVTSSSIGQRPWALLPLVVLVLGGVRWRERQGGGVGR
jgi:hypothetical protein